MTDILDVKTKKAAEAAIAEGKPIRIVGGKFALAVASVTGLHVDIAKTAQVELTLTDVVGRVSQEDYYSSSVVAWGSSRVEAWGYSMLQARGRYVTAKAAATVCVNLWEDAKCDGGRQQVIEMTTPQNWCDYYGVRVEDGCAIVYKAVGEGYVSHWGVAYKPGTMPTDGKWDGRKRECSAGGGLNFSPTVDHTHEFVNAPKHYLECRIRLDDMVVHFGGSYPQKCCAREVVAPLIEVDRDGKPITA